MTYVLLESFSSSSVQVEISPPSLPGRIGSPLTWEVFNVFVKVAVIMGSVVMFPTKRLYTQLSVTVLSLGAHAIVRPYRDKAGNIIVVLFCVCDIIGMYSSISKSPGLQILFVLCLIFTLSAVSHFAFKAAHGRVQDIQAAAAAAFRRPE